MERRALRPAPEASRATLIRRLSLDLRGLPPTISELDRFLADRLPGAYERLVDRWLAAPQLGERWGRHWLDLARYADSSGYESDRPRTIWAYRDWVIHAVNRDMPYDTFVVRQLAGDLLPRPTLADRIATGFHCNAMLDPGVRWEAVMDRVNTTGTALLGLTIGCAQCHSHKTDPIEHREYYQLYAFFDEAVVTTLDLQPAKTLVLRRAPATTHVFERGDPARRGDRVKPGVPAFLGLPIPDGHAAGELTRLHLARWIVHRHNPLTPRVAVNRIWQHLFGVGIVPTSGDFGVQTPPPVHAKLLDYLAAEFVASGWRRKHVIRLIVTSATYRQSSRRRPELRRSSAALFSKQQRLRVDAEVIRDLALSVSGLLNQRVGGPSVFPQQPAGILKNRATPAEWKVSQGGDRYRRGMYTWIWRLTPHPHLPLFDAPDGTACCTRRDRSNVPVQALTMLNDPLFVEASRSLARLLLRQAELRVAEPRVDFDQSRIDWLFRRCLSRRPSDSECRVVAQLVRTQRQRLQQRPAEAAAIAGRQRRLRASGALKSLANEAAWVVVCRAMLNLDEFITRE